MSPTRRRQVRTTRNRVTIGAAVFAVIVSTGVVTRTIASAADAPPAPPVACAPAPGAAPGAPAQQAGQAQSGQATQAAGETRRADRQGKQRLSPGARWLQRRGEMVDRRGVRNIWGDGQAPPSPEPAKPAPVDPAKPAPADPAQPAPADPAQPAPADPAKPAPADPAQPAPADPAKPAPADPAQPAPADPAQPAPADPAKPAPADPANPAPGDPTCTPSANPGANPAPADPAAPPALDILGNSCKGSRLTAHNGLQDGNRCVSTEFGEVANAEKNPSLLITSAPRAVRVNQFFDLKVSTRNLVRDRFLKAAQGGYYKESSFLSADGLVRGHFHTACRMLATTSEAPDPAPIPAFFVATEDGKGGTQPDTVTVRVLGMPQAGLAQCAVWAGDGSHRVPMMQRANQVPAFDVVRIRVS